MNSPLEDFILNSANFIWGTPLLIILMGGGVFFTLYSRFVPFRLFRHAINVLRGKYDHPDDPGEINHFQALMSHIAATVGMGNISGVAVAIVMGGPGALFWMWVSAFVGMATKFFTCTLAIMYRGHDSEGNIQGGPMYVIREGLPKSMGFLAVFFSVAGFFGATPIFQANQIIAAVNETLLNPAGIESSLFTNIILGLVITLFTAVVIFGGIKRIGRWSASLVPVMVGAYIFGVIMILIKFSHEVIPTFLLILEDAFTGKAVLGGSVGALILVGARRAAFSNEAGIGTAPMMHGAAKTKEAVQEGLVAMLGPAVDTLLVCTLTGLAILVTGVWKDPTVSGIQLTSQAFEAGMPGYGPYLLSFCVFTFAFTTIFGLSYYGRKCLSYLIGAKYGNYFNYWYVAIIIIGSITTLDVVVSFVDLAYGLMAFPTVISAIWLAPKVMAETRRYLKSVTKQ